MLKAIIINVKFFIIKTVALFIRITPFRIFFIELLGLMKGFATLCVRIPEWPKITRFARHIGRPEAAVLIVLKYYLQKGIDQIWESVLYEISSLKKYIVVEKKDLLEKSMKKGNGTIILGAHYGPGIYLNTLSGIVRDIKGLVDLSTCIRREDAIKLGLRPLISKRYLFYTEAGRCLPACNKEKALVSHIRNNGVVLMHIDGSGPNRAGGTLTLFGRALGIQSFPFKLALKYNCTVLFCSFVKDTAGAYRLRLVASPQFTTPAEGFSHYLDFIRSQIQSYPFMWTFPPDFLGFVPAHLDQSKG
jgi:lauroyl/myristoyl acyltransferase